MKLGWKIKLICMDSKKMENLANVEKKKPSKNIIIMDIKGHAQHSWFHRHFVRYALLSSLEKRLLGR